MVRITKHIIRTHSELRGLPTRYPDSSGRTRLRNDSQRNWNPNWRYHLSIYTIALPMRIRIHWKVCFEPLDDKCLVSGFLLIRPHERPLGRQWPTSIIPMLKVASHTNCGYKIPNQKLGPKIKKPKFGIYQSETLETFPTCYCKTRVFLVRE